MPGFEIPTDRNGQLWVHFAKHDAARYVSAADVLDGDVGPDKISRKLILIGTSAVGLLDVKTTPLDPVMPGVEVHAQVLESALTRSVLSQPNYAIGAELLAAIVFGLAIIWLAPVLSAISLLIFARRHRRHHGCHILVLLRAAQAADRFHVPAARKHRDLSGTGFQQLLPRAGANAAVFVRRSVSICRRALVEQLAQSPEKLVLGGEGARHDHHVQRRARLHHDLGIVQA